MILTICQRGNVRSATLAAIIKDCHFEKDVIAIGTETTTPELFEQLVKQTEQIWYVGNPELWPGVLNSIEKWIGTSETRPQIVAIDVGHDRLGIAGHPELTKLLLNELSEPTREPRVYTDKQTYFNAALSQWHKTTRGNNG